MRKDLFVNWLLAGLLTAGTNLQAEDARARAYWDTDTHNWLIMPGTCQIIVGSSSRELPLQASLIIN